MTTDIMGTNPCTHRWACATPAGATVLARCRHCGAERTFPSSVASFDYASVPRFVREKSSTGLLKGISYVGYSDGIAR